MKKNLCRMCAASPLGGLSGCGTMAVPDFTDQYQITEKVIPINTAKQTGHIAVVSDILHLEFTMRGD